MNEAKDSDIHPAFQEHLETLTSKQLGLMLIQMKMAGDSKEMIQLVVDAIKRKKP